MLGPAAPLTGDVAARHLAAGGGGGGRQPGRQTELHRVPGAPHSSLLRSVPVPQDAVQRAEMKTRAAPAGTGADEQEEFKQTTNGNGQLVE